MKIHMINNMFGTLFSMLMIVLLASCEGWTDVKSITVEKADIAEQNPEQYNEYLQNLREYRESDHTLVYVWFDNSQKKPFSRAHHIIDLPDSIDIVSMIYPDKLEKWELEEMNKVRKDKAIKVIYTIDFESIKGNYNQKLELTAEEEPVSEDFIGFLTDTLEYSLSLAGKYNYDGICIKYAGKSIQHMWPKELKEYTENEVAFMQIINDWHKRNPQRMITYEGNPQNLIDTSILNDCLSILIPGRKVTSIDEFSYNLFLAATVDIPTDRFGTVVMAISLEDLSKKIGYLSDGSLVMEGLANWAPAIHNGIEVKAVGIYNASTDYYNDDAKKNYYYTRQLISSVNPTIK